MGKRYLIKTRCGSFYAIIRFGKRDRVYFVSIPAFPDVLTEARSLSEAKKYAVELITLQCRAAFDEGKVVVDDMKQVFGKYARSGAVSFAV